MVDADSEPVAEGATAALERILASAAFERSARLSAFLRVIAEERLAGREEPLKEYELGVRVFGRPRNYDPQADPIVRVQARQLRFKLREYYETAGSAERVRIELPKGSCLPVFHCAVKADPSFVGPAEAPANSVEALPAEPQHNTRAPWLLIPIAILVLSAVLFAWNRWHASRQGTRHVPSAEARDLYLEGRYYWSKRNPEALNTAVDYFTQAIVRDPNYAQAYVGLADSYNLLREFAAMPASDAFTRATAAAKRAVTLDGTSAEAHTSLAFCLFWGSWERDAGLREFQRALELNPNYATAHHWYATALVTSGRAQEALVEIERARELDSTSTAIVSDEGLILFYAGEQDRGMDVLRQIEQAEPTFLSPHTYLANFYLARRDFPNFLAEAEKAAQLSHDQPALLIAMVAKKGFSEGGSQAMLERMLKAQKDLYAEGKEPAYFVARTASLLGRRDETLAYLQASLDGREMVVLDIDIEPAFAHLHTDPSWIRLAASVRSTRQ